MSKIFPPRLRNWIKGKWQIGLFIRSPEGSVIEFCADHLEPESGAVKQAARLFNELLGRPAETPVLVKRKDDP